MHVLDFRQLKNIDIQMGRYFTVFAGQNATGKSTLLALLAHSSELKDLTLLGKPFRAPFQEMIKASQRTDLKNEHCVDFEVCEAENWEVTTERFHYRKYWVNTRFKLLPVRKADKNKGITKDSKLKFPVIYLGLSRLYPLGESSTVRDMQFDQSITTIEQLDIVKSHMDIVGLNHIIPESKIEGMVPHNLPSAKKRSAGIRSSVSDERSNSAGQDSVTQILLALVSFRKLKEKTESNGHKWQGGMILIDEFDATLHAYTLHKLLDHVIIQAKELKLQFIFTTHNVTLLADLHEKTKRNALESEKIHDGELYFLDHSTGCVESDRFPSLEKMVGNLHGGQLQSRIVPILCEDEEAAWLFKQLIPCWKKYFGFLPLSLGQDEMKKLLLKSFIVNQWLIVHDSDVDYEAEKAEKAGFIVTRDKNGEPISPVRDQIAVKSHNVVFLPGSVRTGRKYCLVRPERILGDHLIKKLYTHPDADFLDKIGFNQQQINMSENRLIFDIVRANGEGNAKRVREKDKDWFSMMLESHQEVLIQTMISWITENPEQCNGFRKMVAEKYKKICEFSKIFAPQEALKDIEASR